MRILFVNSFFPPDVGGGAELTLTTLVSAMKALGHEVRVAATTDSPLVVDESIAGVEVTRVPLRNLYWHRNDDKKGALKRALWHIRDARNRAMGRGLSTVIRDFSPDIVSLHNVVGFSVAAWDAVRDARVPAVQVLHDYYHVCARSQMFRSGRNCEGQCQRCRVFRVGRARASNELNAVVGVSQAVLDAHVERGLFAQTEIRRVIHNARQFEDLPSGRVYGESARTFGFIGTIAEWKGIRHLLDAFVALRASERYGEDLRLLVAGGGDAAFVAELHAKYRASGVEFLGRSDPKEFFRRIDVSIVPSIWHDPLPGVVFESLLFGVPVIGARRGGIPEMVHDGVNGLLYEPETAGALEACLRQFAGQKGLLARLGRAAATGSGKFASVRRMAAEHEAVYEEVLSIQKGASL